MTCLDCNGSGDDFGGFACAACNGTGVAEPKSLYAVICISNDNGYINQPKVLKSFHQRSGAESFIAERKDKHQTSWNDRSEYINNYVDSLSAPPQLGKEWDRYIIKHYFVNRREIDPAEFKRSLKSHLRTSHPARLPGYNPPEIVESPYNLFIVEIPLETPL